MITKFLFHYTKEKRKIISGIVENDEIMEYDPLKRFPIVEESTVLRPGEKKIISKGKVGYLVFKGEDDKYLDVNIFDGEVKIALTDNISHAACYSKDFFGAILDYAEYFGYDEDPIFVESGLTFDGDMYTDTYLIFKNISDASYCKINKDDKAYFVARDDDQKYYLTDKFEDASKVAKNELRRVLLINNFVNINTPKSSVSFSSFKYLSNENNEYVYAGRNPYRLSLKDDVLSISLNPVIDLNDKLRSNEETFLSLKDISYLISKEESEKSYYLEASNGKYAKKINELEYTLVSNPIDASLLNDYDIEIIKSAYRVIAPDMSFQRKNKNYFLYYKNNEYSICNKPLPNYDNGRMVDKASYEAFMSAFDLSFNNSKRDRGIILIVNDKYLNIELISKTSFKVLITESSYNASLFTKEEASAIKDLLGFKFSERRIENTLLGDLKLYKINSSKPSISNEYRKIMNDVLSKKTLIPDYHDIKELKLETEKASLEYLRRFYIKAVYDYKALFEMVLTDNIKRVLIVAPRLNLELQGLELAAKKEIEVVTLNEQKYGYLPNVSLNNVKYKAAYRLKLQNLPKMFIDQFDLVVFGGGFNEDASLFKPTLDSIIENSNIILANSRIIQAQNDQFNEYFKEKISLKRKYYNYEFPFTELVCELDNTYVGYILSHGGRIHNKVSVQKEDSYYSIVRINKGQIENLL